MEKLKKFIKKRPSEKQHDGEKRLKPSTSNSSISVAKDPNEKREDHEEENGTIEISKEEYVTPKDNSENQDYILKTDITPLIDKLREDFKTETSVMIRKAFDSQTERSRAELQERMIDTESTIDSLKNELLSLAKSHRDLVEQLNGERTRWQKERSQLLLDTETKQNNWKLQLEEEKTKMQLEKVNIQRDLEQRAEIIKQEVAAQVQKQILQQQHELLQQQQELQKCQRDILQLQTQLQNEKKEKEILKKDVEKLSQEASQLKSRLESQVQRRDSVSNIETSLVSSSKTPEVTSKSPLKDMVNLGNWFVVTDYDREYVLLKLYVASDERLQ